MLKTMVGHPDPPFGTETFIPKFLSVNCPQPERDAWLKVMAQTPGAAAPNSQLVGQKEDGPKGLAPSPQGGTVLQAVPAAGWRGLLSGRARGRARGAFWSSAFGRPALATPTVSAPWRWWPVRKNTEAHFPPPQELRVRSWFLGSARNVALKKNGVHLHNALFALCKFLSLNP